MIKERVGDKALRICDVCGQEQWVNYWNIYRKDIHICRYCSCKNTAKVRKNNPWNKGKKFAPKNLGSSYINSNGYVEVWTGESKYQKEHRVFCELDLNRPLSIKEVVHHVDGDKTNNGEENLFVCTGHKHHRNVHSQLERISMELVRSGAIRFNHAEGQYYLDPNVREFISKSGELLGNPTLGNQQRSFSAMPEEERSTTIQRWSTLKRVEAPDNSSS